MFTTNNRMFWGALAAIERLGLTIPSDVRGHHHRLDRRGHRDRAAADPGRGPGGQVAAHAMRLLAERTLDPTLPPRPVSVDLDVEYGTTCGCVPLTGRR